MWLQRITLDFMKKQYRQPTFRWGLLLLCVLGLPRPGQAQPAAPLPLIQWQRVIEGDEVTPATVQAAKTSNGGYAVLAGKNLIRLSATGAVLSNNRLTGTYQDSTATYAPVQ